MKPLLPRWASKPPEANIAIVAAAAAVAVGETAVVGCRKRARRKQQCVYESVVLQQMYCHHLLDSNVWWAKPMRVTDRSIAQSIADGARACRGKTAPAPPDHPSDPQRPFATHLARARSGVDQLRGDQLMQQGALPAHAKVVHGAILSSPASPRLGAT